MKNSESKPDTTGLEPEITVHSLRRNGFKTRVIHLRYTDDQTAGNYVGKEAKARSRLTMVPCSFKKFFELETHGGATHIVVTDEDRVDYHCHSICSRDDVYSYKRGVAEALKHLPAVLKLKVWHAEAENKVNKDALAETMS